MSWQMRRRDGIIKYMVNWNGFWENYPKYTKLWQNIFRKKEGIASGRRNQKNDIRIPMF